jgi:hypothetical protein
LVNHGAIDACPVGGLGEKVCVLVVVLLDLLERNGWQTCLNFVDNFAEVSLHSVSEGVHVLLILEEKLS